MDATALLAWFGPARRALPWRSAFPRDPYSVLVSEVLAQQTQVARVVAAYDRFMTSFPTVGSLAAAEADAVLAAFAGLGYYRRARLLHATARAVIARGSWPATYAELLALPGIGPYTAAAVAAFAFGGDTPPVDGNVARVAARLATLAWPLGAPRLLAAGRQVAADLHAQAPVPEVFEALMELGATVCAPAAPRCAVCPLQSWCACGEPKAALRIPLPRPQRPTHRVRWVAVWLERPDHRVLLRRVDTGPVLQGLWLPPIAELARGADAGHLAAALARAAGYEVRRLVRLGEIRHSITHRAIEVIAFLGCVGSRLAEGDPSSRWADPADGSLPTSSLLAKIAAARGSTDPTANGEAAAWPDP